MYLTANFSLAELTRSETAERLGIDNTPTPAHRANLLRTAEMLERIRQHLSAVAGRSIPILVSSGYRGPALNARIGGSPTSDHMEGLAADWIAPRFGTPFQVASALAPHVSSLGIGQLIHEFGRWIHTGVEAPARPVNRIITISRAGTVPGVVAV